MMAVEGDPFIAWLLQGEPATRWQVHADLLASVAEVVEAERDRIAEEGWEAA